MPAHSRLWATAAALAVCAGCAHPSTYPGRGLGEGLASYYGPGLAGHRTASGETFDPRKLTAAHRTLAFGTCVRVLNVRNGREVDVRVNDRGPFAKERIIDVSEAAGRRLDMIASGVAHVRLTHCP